MQLSVDHTVYNEDEMCRLLTIGLDRDELKREGRLGTQENTRCIGDYTIKDGYAEIESLRSTLYFIQSCFDNKCYNCFNIAKHLSLQAYQYRPSKRLR